MNRLAKAAALAGLTAFNTNSATAQFFIPAEEPKSVLQNVADGAALAIYRHDTTQGFCDDMEVNVLPVLNSVDLTSEFKATFEKARGTLPAICTIEFDGNPVFHAFANSLKMGEKFDTRVVATDILQILGRDDLVKINAVLPTLIAE